MGNLRSSLKGGVYTVVLTGAFNGLQGTPCYDLGLLVTHSDKEKNRKGKTNIPLW